jgi:hypothetical protein
VCGSELTPPVLVHKLSLRFRRAAPRRDGKLGFGGFGFGRFIVSSFAWIVLGLIAGLFCRSLSDGAGAAGVIDVVLGFALVPVFYGAVCRKNPAVGRNGHPELD